MKETMQRLEPRGEAFGPEAEPICLEREPFCPEAEALCPEAKEETCRPERMEKRGMGNSYLVIDTRGNTETNEDVFEEEMIRNNVIPGLLRLESCWMDGAKEYRYCIDDRHTLERELQGRRISGIEYQRLFESIFEAIGEARRFLLSEDGFLLAKDSIYLHNETGAVELCYLPGHQYPLVEQLRELSEWMLDFIDTNDEQAVYCGYAFHVLCHGEACSFRGLEDILIRGKALEGAVVANVVDADEITMSDSQGGLTMPGDREEEKLLQPWQQEAFCDIGTSGDGHWNGEEEVFRESEHTRRKAWWNAARGVLIAALIVGLVFVALR